jgi:hypothetical protein
MAMGRPRDRQQLAEHTASSAHDAAPSQQYGSEHRAGEGTARLRPALVDRVVPHYRLLMESYDRANSVKAKVA